MESNMRNAMGDNRVCVRVYVHPNVRVDRVPSSEEGLEAGCQAPTEFHNPEGGAGEAVGADFSYMRDKAGRSSGVLTPWWDVWC